MTDVVMPQMGESIVEGTLTRWLKKVGEKVERDEPLFEISTDKVDTEIPSPAAGDSERDTSSGRRHGGINTVVGRIDDGAGASAAPPRSSATRSGSASSPLRKLAPAQAPPPPAPPAQAPAPQAAAPQAAAAGPYPSEPVRKRRRKRKMKPAHCRRWFVRWRASTTSTCRKCAAPASVAESPSRMSKPTWLRKARAR